jgi:integrase
VASIRRYLTSGGERRWEVRWRDPRGRERCKTFNREGDAKRYRVDVERRQQLGPLYDARPELLGDFERGWFDRYQQTVRPATFDRSQQARRHLREFEALYVQQVTAQEVEDRIVSVAKTAPRQAQIALALMKQILLSARERGQIVDEAVFRIRPPKHEEREARFLTWAQVEQLASVCSEGRLIVFAALTGLRQGEVFALRDANVDLADSALVVDSSAYKGRAARTKTRSGRRRVYLSSVGRQTVQEQLLARQPNPQGLVFPAPSGCIWQKDNFMSRVFRPAVRRAELDGLTFHDLRHTCASLMIAAGANPLEVASQLGHKDARLVLQRYGHLYPGASARAAQRLDAVTSGVGVGEAWGEA